MCWGGKMEAFFPDDLDFLSEVVDSLLFQDSRNGGSGPRGEWRVLNSCRGEWERETTHAHVTAGKEIVKSPPKTRMKGPFLIHL